MTGTYQSKHGPVEGCPVSETPIRDRAWTDEQKSGPQIVCCVCGDPCSIYSPICVKCMSGALSNEGATP